jgi:hypothetical protein
VRDVSYSGQGLFLPFEAKSRVNNIQESSPYRKENTHFSITKINWLTLFQEKNSLFTVRII